MVYSMTNNSIEGMENFSVNKLNNYQCEISIEGRRFLLTDNSLKYKEYKKNIFPVKLLIFIASLMFILSMIVIFGTVGYYEYSEYVGNTYNLPISYAIIRCALALALMYVSGVIIEKSNKVEKRIIRNFKR